MYISRARHAACSAGPRIAAWALAAVLFAAACSGGDVSAPAPPATDATASADDSAPLLAEDDALLARLQIAAEDDQGIDYERDDYAPRGWRDDDGDGCNTRELVLIAEAISLRGRTAGCRPVDGVWLSWFDGRRLTAASEVEIDHLVPLAEAHRSGAVRWPSSAKAAFANDLSRPETLAAVSARSNRDKSDSDPAEWRPPLRSAWCRYARDWITVKIAWSLSADRAEAAALREMLATCIEPQPPQAQEHPDRQVPTIPYDDCDAAEAAGLARRQGSSGQGRGFPAAQIAFAKDGDNDGIVCER